MSCFSFRISINTIGCKTNQSESDDIAGLLRERGYEIVSCEEDPDFCLINTCTVTSQTDKKVRQLVRRIRALNPSSTVIVMGCFVVLNKDFLIREGVDYLVENKDKDKVCDLIDKLSHEKLTQKKEYAGNKKAAKRVGKVFHTRALIKIQDGCEQGCSYCIVPMVRGAYKSVHPYEIISKIKKFEEEGLEEVVLTGIHIGKYGVDFNKNLYDLLQLILEASSIKRVRLSSIEICEISPEIINLISESGRIAPHLHIPLQSGSDRILRRMERPYTGEYFLKRVESIKEKIPHISITTDVMVGFPGETEEDFLKTVDLVKEISFSKLHVFKYSRRPYTKASEMEDQVPENVKTYRSRYLREIGEELRKKYLEKNIREKLEVLVERVDLETRTANGVSQNYIRVYFSLNGSFQDKVESEVRKGRIVEVVAESLYKDGLFGKVVKI